MKQVFIITLAAGAHLCLIPEPASAGPRALRLEPDRIELPLGGTRQFRTHGAPSRGSAVRWRVMNGVGAVTDEGFYSAPARAATPVTAVLRAECEGAAAGEARVLIPAV